MNKTRNILRYSNSQAWSIGIMLAVVIFIGAVFVFFGILNTKQGTKADELRDEAINALKAIASGDPDIGIIIDDEIDQEKLDVLLSTNYSIIKKKLRIKNDFCLYFEDENGDIIYINVSTSATHAGIGSDKIKISGIPCG